MSDKENSITPAKPKGPQKNLFEVLWLAYEAVDTENVESLRTLAKKMLQTMLAETHPDRFRTEHKKKAAGERFVALSAFMGIIEDKNKFEVQRILFLDKERKRKESIARLRRKGMIRSEMEATVKTEEERRAEKERDKEANPDKYISRTAHDKQVRTLENNYLGLKVQFHHMWRCINSALVGMVPKADGIDVPAPIPFGEAKGIALYILDSSGTGDFYTVASVAYDRIALMQMLPSIPDYTRAIRYSINGKGVKPADVQTFDTDFEEIALGNRNYKGRINQHPYMKLAIDDVDMHVKAGRKITDIVACCTHASFVPHAALPALFKGGMLLRFPDDGKQVRYVGMIHEIKGGKGQTDNLMELTELKERKGEFLESLRRKLRRDKGKAMNMYLARRNESRTVVRKLLSQP